MLEFGAIDQESIMLPLLLASSSAYRRELLARLRLPFSWASPDLDEQRLADEPAVELVRRLARQKPKRSRTATQGI
jgi:predicted house-cleaning NTP pyrophosphatase (Maf/HAM1 superfamily)